MRISLGLPAEHHHDDGSPAPADLRQQAVAAEAAGVDAVFVTDHPGPTDRWVAGGGHHAMDPLVALGFVAAATSSVLLHTNLLIPAYRHPWLVAQGVATLDHVSGGRVVLGAGVGYLEDEFALFGADFAGRIDATDDALRLARRLWSGEAVDGRTLFPAPGRAGGPPIWVGGNSRRAARRAAELGEGWSPFPLSPRGEAQLHTPALDLSSLAARIREAQDLAHERGRPPLDVAFMAPSLTMFSAPGWSAEEVLDQAGAMAEIGVTWLVVALPSGPAASWHAQVDRVGAELVPGLRSIA